jgi:hypothetical protein
MISTSQRIAVRSQGWEVARDPPTRWPPPPHFYFDTLTGRPAPKKFDGAKTQHQKFFAAKFWVRGQDVLF